MCSKERKKGAEEANICMSPMTANSPSDIISTGIIYIDTRQVRTVHPMRAWFQKNGDILIASGPAYVINFN